MTKQCFFPSKVQPACRWALPWFLYYSKDKKIAWTLPEIFSTVDAGEDLATPAHVHMFLHLSFFQRFAASVASKKHHFATSTIAPKFSK